MKQDDVYVGSTYMTYIGKKLSRVIVTDEKFYDHTKEFQLRRQGGREYLPKWRTAGELHPIPKRNAGAEA